MVAARAVGSSLLLCGMLAAQERPSTAITATIREHHRSAWDQDGLPALPAQPDRTPFRLAFVGSGALAFAAGTAPLLAREPDWRWQPVTVTSRASVVGTGDGDGAILQTDVNVLRLHADGSVEELVDVEARMFDLAPCPWAPVGLLTALRGGSVRTALLPLQPDGRPGANLFPNGLHVIVAGWTRAGGGIAAAIGDFRAGGGENVLGVAIAPDGDRVTHTLPITTFVSAVEFAADGRSLFVAADTLTRWDVSTGKQVAIAEQRLESFVVLDERQGVGVDGEQLSLWDLATMRTVKSFPLDEKRPGDVPATPRHRGAVLAVAWSAARDRVAILTFAGLRVFAVAR